MSQAMSPDPIWASMPIVKFSHLTSLYGKGYPPWAHVAADNLTLLIQTFRTCSENGGYDQRVMMKVLRGAEILETQDIGRLAQTYRHATTSTELEAVEVMVSSPRMAMRYPKPDDSIRKIQVRFQSDADCAKVMNIIIELGLPIKSPTAVPTSRPGPSPAPSMLTSSSSSVRSSSSVGLPARPVSTASSLSNDRPIGFASSSPYFDFKVPERPATSEHNRDLTKLNGREPPSIAGSNYAMTVPAFQSSPFYGTRNDLYTSQLEREPHAWRSSQPLSQQFDHLGTVSGQASSMFRRQVPPPQADRERVGANSRLVSSSSFFPPSLSGQLEPALTDPFWVPSTSQRPASTPADSYDLPPRRVLPFEPSRRPSSAADLPALPKPTPVPIPSIKEPTSSGMPTTSKPNLVANPSPEVADKGDLCPQEPLQVPVSAPSPKKVLNSVQTPVPAPVKRIAQRKKPAVVSIAQPSTGNDTVSYDTSPIKPISREINFAPPNPHKDEPSPLAAKSAAAAATAPRPASAASGLVSKAGAPTRKRTPAPIRPPLHNKRPKMINTGTQTEEYLTRKEPAKEQAPAIKDVPGLLNDVHTAASSPPATYLDDLDAFVTRYQSRPAPKELWQMPGYQEASEEDRHAIINDFICDNLENPAFLQLCEDMETTWRRIGLGM